MVRKNAIFPREGEKRTTAYARNSTEKKIRAGGKRLHLMLSPEVNSAMQFILDNSEAGCPTEVVSALTIREKDRIQDEIKIKSDVGSARFNRMMETSRLLTSHILESGMSDVNIFNALLGQYLAWGDIGIDAIPPVRYLMELDSRC